MHAFGQEATVSRRFAAAVERAFAAARSRLLARAGLTAIAIALIVTSIVGILWFGSRLVIGGEISGGRLGQFVLYAVFAAGAIAELSEVWGELAQAAGAAERLLELLAARPEIKAPPRPRPLPVPPLGSIAFRDVRFFYPVAPGRVGPQRRELRGRARRDGRHRRAVGGRQEHDLQPAAALLRRAIGHRRRRRPVGRRRRPARAQAAHRPGAAGRRPVRRHHRREHPLRPHRRQRCRCRGRRQAAQAESFIAALPQAYDTRLGERGVTLSGGQRQRIALARAILRDAPILLLDEATSSLDAESEVAVQEALQRLTQSRTTLVIAHRLATVQRASRILVMDKGRIVEEGRHADLVRRGGLYGRLAELQFALDAAQ